EKSIADKVEKGCLRCGYGLGTAAPNVGLVGSVAVNVWKSGALLAAEKAGVDAGITAATDALKRLLGLGSLTKDQWTNLLSAETFKNPTILSSSLKVLSDKICLDPSGSIIGHDSICLFYGKDNATVIRAITTHTKTAAKNAAAEATRVTEAEIIKVTATSTNYYTVITSSVITIVVIVLIMVIIYLILRYIRKKKMKKKLQYIKLLEE
ncbi:rifin, partial [Plasmodium sp. DRC-Itaito]